MAVNINVPSQVRTFANLAAFPATGALKTIYIAEDTNKTYRWTGSVYVEVSGADFSGYVPTSRTLTINGTTQDLSADRTFTISTGITIGTTAITSGTVGRVLFQGTGNVVQQSSSLFWDATNNRLGIGTATPNSALEVVDTGAASFVAPARFLVPNNNVSGRVSQFYLGTSMTTLNSIAWNFHYQGNGSTANYQSFGFNGVANPALAMFGTLNVGIGTTTDAGFRLDVNGTARVQNTLTVTKGAGNFFTFEAAANGSDLSIRFFKTGQLDVSLSTRNAVNVGALQISDGLGLNGGFVATRLAANAGIIAVGNTSGDSLLHVASSSGFSSYVSFREQGAADRGILGFQNGTSYLQIRTNGATNMSNGTFSTAFFSTGNVGINTTTDAGFRLDVNGTARFNGNLTFQTTSWILDNSNAIMHRGGFNVESIAFNLSRMVFTDNNGFVFNANNSGATLTASSIVDIQSTTKGFLPPRMTTTQRNAIVSPAAGLMVYDTTLNVISYYNGTMWI